MVLQILDLVHPSMFSLACDVSRAIPLQPTDATSASGDRNTAHTGEAHTPPSAAETADHPSASETADARNSNTATAEALPPVNSDAQAGCSSHPVATACMAAIPDPPSAFV